MAHALTNVLVHVVFSTKNRQKDLRREIQNELKGWMTASIEEQGGKACAIGFGLDHVHLMIKLPANLALATLVQKLKGGTSYRLKREVSGMAGFSWQPGYSAFSVSQSKFRIVCEYINTQEERHRGMSFEKEVFSLLKRNEIEFDERLWEL